MKRKNWTVFILSILILCSLFTVVAYAASGDTIVYRTKTGSCYHTQNCSYLKSSYEIKLKDAVNKGLRPCSRCNPPTLDTKSSNQSTAPNVSTRALVDTGTKFKVKITAECTDNNSVGSDWSKVFYIDGTTVKSGDIVYFDQSDKLTIKTKITEYDAGKSDVGTKETTYKVTASDISNGFTITQTITVKENDGKYKGNTATWEVEYKFTRG